MKIQRNFEASFYSTAKDLHYLDLGVILIASKHKQGLNAIK
jgi:hypothetical protein